MLSLILLNEQIYNKLQNQIIASQPVQHALHNLAVDHYASQQQKVQALVVSSKMLSSLDQFAEAQQHQISTRHEWWLTVSCLWNLLSTPHARVGSCSMPLSCCTQA